MTSEAARALVLKRWKVQRKITVAQREEIRERRQAGESARELAAEFGVSANYVRKIGRGDR